MLPQSVEFHEEQEEFHQVGNLLVYYYLWSMCVHPQILESIRLADYQHRLKMFVIFWKGQLYSEE